MMMRVHYLMAFAICSLAVGCGPNVGGVSGKVTFNGKPVVYGTVVIVGPDGNPKSGPIGPDGTYRVVDVGVGVAKIAVSSPQPPGAASAAKAKPTGGRDVDTNEKEPPPGSGTAQPVSGWVALPPQFGEPSTSGLIVTVASGTTTHNIDLK